MTCKERILSNDYADLIIDYVLPEEALARQEVDYCFRAIDEEFGIAYVNRDEIPPLSVGVYTYSSIPNLYGLMQTFQAENLVEMGNLRMQSPPLSLQGRGVIIGFVDTGIRYNLDAFKDENGNSRILSIWDQTIQTGAPPEDFLYGTEYTREEINRALYSGEPLSIVPTTDENGHGTAMASAAAGSVLNEGLTFRGAAPQADIAVVKLKGAKQYLREYYLIADDAVAYQENDIMEGVRYLERMAIVFERPVVIVLGTGTNMGDHAGNSPLASYLDRIAAKRSRAVVVCGGNEGDKEHHYSASIPEQIEMRVAENTSGFCMELWGNRIDIYSVVLRTPGGEMTSAIDFRNGPDNTHAFLFDRTRIYTGLSLVEKRSGNELIFFRFENPTPGIWSIMVRPSEQERLRGSGQFHIWLPITSFIGGAVTFLEPDPDVTLTEPSNAEHVITVSTYNGQTGSWFSESGRGFTVNDSIKPDLAAPGVQVSTILGNRTGSSMAAALSAGCVAQFMEWAVVNGYAPYGESRAIKSHLIRGAVRENTITYPDRRWGYGKLNISGTFESLARI
ncbi:MAG: S8 family peptidase [Roseburia sp.]|nr:S8 family peptidase [Ruminococcus sp.]MCM1154204.1 S8 family peptidase [Roseburia sp.]MCM1241330.1 S8 family peptidase [Roseburia sp.]